MEGWVLEMFFVPVSGLYSCFGGVGWIWALRVRAPWEIEEAWENDSRRRRG